MFANSGVAHLRILIAEDDPISRRLVVAFLQKWGHEVTEAVDGLEATRALEADDTPPLAVLDWMMPGLDGLEVLRRLRRAEAEQGRTPVYVILLTAKGGRDSIAEGFTAGADDYILKPFDHDELRGRLSAGVRIVELQLKLADRIRELEAALQKVKTLQGLLPICSYCKKIRDDRDYWTEVESYIARVAGAEFSHGVCPSCFDKHLRPRLEQMAREKASSR